MQSHFQAPWIDNSSETVSFNKVPEEQLSRPQQENKWHLVRPPWFLDSAHWTTDLVWSDFTQEFDGILEQKVIVLTWKLIIFFRKGVMQTHVDA